MKDISFDPLFTKSNSSFWLRTDMKFARTKTSEIFNRIAKTKNTRYIQKILKALPSNCWIAGGAAKDIYTNNSENINDIDIYSTSKEEAIKAYEALQTLKGEAIKQSRMAISVKVKDDLPIASLIKICYFENMEHCLDSFDFTICQFAIGVEESVCNPMGLIDHLNKKLNVHVLQPQTDCLFRLVKYVKKGYTPTNSALDHIHDFLSGNHVPTREERPATYGSLAIDNALQAIPTEVRNIPAPAGVAWTPPPAQIRRNVARPPTMVRMMEMQAREQAEETYVRDSRAMNEPLPPQMPATSYDSIIQEVIDETDRAAANALATQVVGSTLPPAPVVPSAPTGVLMPGDTTVVTAPVIRPTIYQIVGGPMRTNAARRGRDGLIRTSGGTNRRGET